MESMLVWNNLKTYFKHKYTFNHAHHIKKIRNGIKESWVYIKVKYETLWYSMLITSDQNPPDGFAVS